MNNGMFADLLKFAAGAAIAGAAANIEYNRRLENAVARLKLGIETEEDMLIICKEVKIRAQNELDNCRKKRRQLEEESDNLFNNQIIPYSMIINAVESFKNDPALDEFHIMDKDTVVIVLKKTTTAGKEEITAYTPSGNYFDMDNIIYIPCQAAENRNKEIENELDKIEEREKICLEVLAELGY